MLPESHPVLSCAEAKAWEAGRLRDEAAEWEAMRQAGAAIAQAIAQDCREVGGWPAHARLLALVGKGHNGGDALLAVKDLLRAAPQAQADVLLVAGEQAFRPLAARAWAELRQAAGDRVRVVALPELKAAAAGYDLCLDGVFGFQFRPPLDAAVAETLAWVNTHPRIRVRAAVDLPSGMAGTNAPTVFRADFTYATGIVKSPLLAAANATWVGRIRYLDLGFFSGVAGVGDPGPKSGNDAPGSATPATRPGGLSRVLLPSLLRPLARLRPAQADKRTFGHLLVVGGSRSYPGAVLMTVQAALRSGVGLLTAFVPASLAPEYAARFPEAMWVGLPESEHGGLSLTGLPLIQGKLAQATALALGPGLGAEAGTLALVGEVLRQASAPVLLDADALRPEVLQAAAGHPHILTPHAGEFRRIAGETEAQEFARRQSAVVVLKGSPTQISDGNGVYFSLAGGPVLARGGSGDLLAGLIGGLLAQAPDDLLLAACRGVVWHGLAADLLARDKGQVAVQTTQLLDHLPAALRLADHALP